MSRKFSTHIRKKLFRRKDAANETSSLNTDSDSAEEESLLPPFPVQPAIRAHTLMSGLSPCGSAVTVDYETVLPEDDEELNPPTEEDCTSSPSSNVPSGCGNIDLDTTEPDIYGQRHPKETDELIATKLAAFDKAVAKIPTNKKKGVNEAMFKCPKLLDDKFKLMFLRSEVFNEKLAAKRYAKYWDMRIYVFGPERAFLPLTQSEALKDDMFALSTGCVTLTGTKDFAGRNIMYADMERQQIGAYTTESMTRAIWYIYHAALEDEDTQKRGLVCLADLRPSRLSLFHRELVRIVALSVQGCIPVRISGIHGCDPPPIFHAFYPLIKLLMGERLRKRVRLHSGSIEHVQEELSKYGLTKTVLPTDLGGDVILDHQSWLAERRKEVEI